MSNKEKNTNKQQQGKSFSLGWEDAMFAVMVLFVLEVLGFTVIEPEIKKSTGVVRARNAKELYVQDLKDTARYNIFEYRQGMYIDKRNAFPYVATGDTLKYVIPNDNNTGSFELVRKVNGERLNKFAKHRRQIAESAKIRNMINQRTK